MPRGGRRIGAGRRAREKVTLAANKKLALELLSMTQPPIHPGSKADPCRCQICRWWDYLTAKDLRLRFDADRCLEERLNGKAVQPNEDKIIFDPNKPLVVRVEHIGKK